MKFVRPGIASLRAMVMIHGAWWITTFSGSYVIRRRWAKPIRSRKVA
jgi:hypothetical protein